MIDICGNLNPVINRSCVKFGQQTGRGQRLYKNKEKCIMFDCFCFDNEEDKVRKIVEMISDYILGLKAVESDSKDYNLCSEFERLTKVIEVDNDNKLIKIKLKDNKVIVLNVVSSVLQNINWKDLPEKIKEEINRQLYTDGITCAKAMEIIKFYKEQKGVVFNNKEDYYELCKENVNLPVDPMIVFTNFPGWVEYLQIDRTLYYPSPHAVKQSIKTIQSKYNGHKDDLGMIYNFCRLHDEKLPPIPCEFYKNYGIKNMTDLISISMRKKRILDV